MDSAARRKRACLRRAAQLGPIFIAGGLLTACSAGASPVAEAPRPAPPSASPATDTTPKAPVLAPDVLVTIVVDQLAAWVVAERIDRLSEDGGLALLRKRGLYVEDMRYAHAYCATGPGHSSLYTGQTPNMSGIANNGAIDPRTGAFRSLLADDSAHLITDTGQAEGGGASSLLALTGKTLADQLRERHPDAAIVSISLKDRGALFGGGRKPDATIWWDTSADAFVTSSALATSLPAWVQRSASASQVESARAQPWVVEDEQWLKQRVTTIDNAPGEGAFYGLTTTFPHRAASTKLPAKSWRATPASDRVLVQMANAALDDIGTGRKTLLALSLSSNDYIGHAFGPESWEAWEGLREIDALLGDFIRSLDQRFGSNGYSLMLTADHGIVPMPESVTQAPKPRWCTATPDRWERPCTPTKRMISSDVERDLVAAIRAKVGAGKWLDAFDEPYVQLSQAALDAPPERRMAIERAIIDHLEGRPEIRAVFPTAALPDPCPPIEDESVEALVCRAVKPGLGGDYYVLAANGHFFDVGYTIGLGANHGTPYLYDRSVPLFVMSPLVESGVVHQAPIDFRAFSRTAASLLGITSLPASEAGHDFSKSQRSRSERSSGSPEQTP